MRVLSLLSAAFVFLSFGGPDAVYTPPEPQRPTMPWEYQGPALPTVEPIDVRYQGHKGRWVDVRATAYSPHDAVDSEYHATKGKWRWKTADGTTDVRKVPYGVAVPRIDGEPWLPYGSRVIIPAGHGYVDRSRRQDRVFSVDDTGGRISQRTRKDGIIYLDLRWKHTESALQWAGPLGYRTLRIFVIEEE